MTKMNINYLLSPENKPPASSSSRSSHAQRTRDQPRREAPLDLDFIAPRGSSSQSRGQNTHQPRSSGRGSSSSSTRDEQKSSSKSGNSNTKSPDGEREKRHACPSCERTFFKLEQLKRHDRLVHLNLRPYICATCDLSFGTKQNMQVHLTTRKHRHRLETLKNHHNAFGPYHSQPSNPR